MEKWPITFTDIRPGFVRTDLLKDGRNYPMLMSPQYAALRIANAIDRKREGRSSIGDTLSLSFLETDPRMALGTVADTELGSDMSEVHLLLLLH